MANQTEKNTRAIATLTGSYHALFMFCQAVAMTHPNPGKLKSAMEETAQGGLASIEVLPIPDAAIDGFQYVQRALERALAVNQA